MSEDVFVVIVFAGLLHAVWNAAIKSSSKIFTAIGVNSSAGIVSLLLVFFVPPLSFNAFPFIVASATLQIIYTLLTGKIYQVSELSHAYPIMRGVAPLIVMIVSLLFMQQILKTSEVTGIAVICCSVLMLTLSAGKAGSKGTLLSALNALIIAGYTIIDSMGIRHSDSALAYILWVFATTGLGVMASALLIRGESFARYYLSHWKITFLGGVCTLSSYGLVLWAMTQAPVAIVSALRETSVFSGIAISILFLGEKPSRVRLLSATGIACGAIILKLV